MTVETSCKYCGSSDVVKYGIRSRKHWDVQNYVCRVCRRMFSLRIDKRPAVPEAERVPLFPVPENNATSFTWSSYNEAQMQEKLLFLGILEDLCSRLRQEEVGRVGRPSAGTREMVFCMVAKLYEGLSSRRVSSDLTIAMQRGHISKVPHFNTILKYFNDPAMTPLLTNLVELSALPLKDFETTFAVDASGLSSAFYSRWLDVRLNPKKKAILDWIKVHIICGVKSNIVTAITVTDGTSNDSPHFPELVRRTAEHFRVKEVMADKAYSSKANIQASFDVGAVPYIPFKTNTSGKADGSMVWAKMFHYFQLHREEFMQRYHQRSNVESTFSALKRKFSGKLMLKNEVGQVNEALALLLCHNICVLIREAFENGTATDFNEVAHLFPNLHINEPKHLENV